MYLKNIMKTISLKKACESFAMLLGSTCWSQSASSLSVEIGGNAYYQKIPCIAKIAFKYKNEDFEPLVTRLIQTSF